MKAEIELYGPNHGSISLDDVDISRAVRGGSFHFGVDEAPLLTLDLGVYEGVSAKGEVDVVVGAVVHELLVRLGWTPPSPAPSSGAVPPNPPGG